MPWYHASCYNDTYSPVTFLCHGIMHHVTMIHIRQWHFYAMVSCIMLQWYDDTYSPVTFLCHGIMHHVTMIRWYLFASDIFMPWYHASCYNDTMILIRQWHFYAMVSCIMLQWYDDTYSPVTFLCHGIMHHVTMIRWYLSASDIKMYTEFVLVTFHSYSALTNRQNINDSMFQSKFPFKEQ